MQVQFPLDENLSLSWNYFTVFATDSTRNYFTICVSTDSTKSADVSMQYLSCKIIYINSCIAFMFTIACVIYLSHLLWTFTLPVIFIFICSVGRQDPLVNMWMFCQTHRTIFLDSAMMEFPFLGLPSLNPVFLHCVHLGVIFWMRRISVGFVSRMWPVWYYYLMMLYIRKNNWYL
jgi:hypothetical protein